MLLLLLLLPSRSEVVPNVAPAVGFLGVSLGSRLSMVPQESSKPEL